MNKDYLWQSYIFGKITLSIWIAENINACGGPQLYGSGSWEDRNPKEKEKFGFIFILLEVIFALLHIMLF